MGAFDEIISAFGGGTSTPAPVAQTFAQIKTRPGRVLRKGSDFDKGIDKALAMWKAYAAQREGDYVAQTRITRTPVYAVSGANWPESKAAEYDPLTGRINVPDEQLQANPGWILPHESAHAIFDKADLSHRSAGLLHGMQPDSLAMEHITNHPELYGDYPLPWTIANEGLAYSIPERSGDAYVNYMAGQIKDPVLAQRLQRLHQNATAPPPAPPPLEPMQKIGDWFNDVFGMRKGSD